MWPCLLVFRIRDGTALWAVADGDGRPIGARIFFKTSQGLCCQCSLCLARAQAPRDDMGGRLEKSNLPTFRTGDVEHPGKGRFVQCPTKRVSIISRSYRYENGLLCGRRDRICLNHMYHWHWLSSIAYSVVLVIVTFVRMTSEEKTRVLLKESIRLYSDILFFHPDFDTSGETHKEASYIIQKLSFRLPGQESFCKSLKI